MRSTHAQSGGSSKVMASAQVVQYEERTVSLKLRTPAAVEHLHLSWHQTAARLCLGAPPDRGAVSEAFAFGVLTILFAMCRPSCLAPDLSHGLLCVLI